MVALPERLNEFGIAASRLSESDPLRRWRHSSEATRRATQLSSVAEVALRKPNKSGGTEWGAALMLALMRRRSTLDGIPIPRLTSPRLTGVVGSLDYKQQVFSVQEAYLRLLGEWPHQVRRTGEVVNTLRIMPEGGSRTDTSHWSRIVFVSQENPRAGVGYRCDAVHFDEPPAMEFLREMRKAGYPGRPMVRVLTYTPIVRSQWWPLEQDFAGCMDTPKDGRVMVWLSDLHQCSHLSAQDIHDLENAYRGDPWANARLTGLPFDGTGFSPWGDLFGVLDEMMAESEQPVMEPWSITRETDTDKGRVRVVERVEVEVYKRPVAGRRYYLPVDPSSGIKSDLHDPGALHVVDWETGGLCARYCGYIGAYGLGSLAAGLGRQYGHAQVDPETTGGWGGPVLTALTDAGYGAVAQQQRELTPGTWETQLGFRTTTETRPVMISSIQEWIKAYAAGHKYACCPSRSVLQSLKDLVLDAKGKPVAAPGLHDEDAILWGQALRHLKPGRYRGRVEAAQVPGPRRPPWMREAEAAHRPTLPRVRAR